MGKKINEKTLELNLCSELSRFFRILGIQTIWRGLTQAEEAKWGFDVATSLPNGRLIFIQWKSPKLKTNASEYKFSINDAQLGKLVRLSLRNPNSVFYGFPRVSDWADYRKQKFFALPDTRFLDVSSLQAHSSLGLQTTHTATIASSGSQAIVTSKPVSYSAKSISEIVGGPAMPRMGEFLSGVFSFVLTRDFRENVFSPNDPFHPIFLETRNKFLSELPKANEEVYSSLKDYFKESDTASRKGFVAGLLFDSLEDFSP